MVGPDGFVLASAPTSDQDAAVNPDGAPPASVLVPNDVVIGAEAILAAEPDIEPNEALRRSPERTSFATSIRSYVRRSALFDALIGGTAVLAPAAVSNTLSRDPWVPVAITVVGLVAWPLVIGLNHGYRRNHVGVGSEELRAVLRAAVAVVVAGAFPAGLLHQQALLTMVVIAVPLSAVGSLLVRFVMRKALHASQRKGMNVRRVVVAGSATSVVTLSERLRAEAHSGLQVIGACVPGSSAPEGFALPVLGGLDGLAASVRRVGCDAVAITSDDATRQGYLRSVAWALEGTGVELFVDPGLVEVAGPRMHIRPLLGLPLLHVEQPQFAGATRVAKRIADMILTLVGLVLIAPALLAIAVMIKTHDHGPVFFRQVRIGRAGRPFTMVKFRTMVVDAEGRKAGLLASTGGNTPLFKMARDPRVTQLGAVLRRFSLDELPQLFNVLTGSMSLVGPRPHLASEIARMPQEAIRRSLVTPGLTGLWQVSGRSELSATESIRLDLRYVENWSLSLDLMILWKTVSAVIAGRGAY